MVCEKCNSGCYCSSACREKHVTCRDHIILCVSIQRLERLQMNKRLAALPLREKTQVPMKRKLVSLVGEKPIVNCRLSGKESEALWDTGAMVSMVDKPWLEENHPFEDIQSLEEFLEGDTMHLLAANNSKVAVEGVVTLSFEIGEFSVSVPFIVSTDPVSQPIIGYNVIKHLVFAGGEQSCALLKLSCPSIAETNLVAVINLIKKEALKEDYVVSTKENIIPANSRYKVKCKTGYRASELEESVMFSPNPLNSELEMEDLVTKVRLGRGYTHVVVKNPTNKPLVLDKGAVLGSIESVSAVIPIMPGKDPLVELGGGVRDHVEVQTVEVGGSSSRTWLPPVDLSHLSEDKKKMVEKVLMEEGDVFCQEGMLHGDVPEMVMDINLTDQVPVVIPHRQIPRPFYEEVKNFVNDLIVNKWVRESKSSWSSPIVCVRKPCGGLRMCIDYRALNKKIISDKMPIPRISEIFDGLEGQEWFSTLDMAKAYHQGYVREPHRKFTAFSTPWGLYEWIRIPMGISNAPPVFQRYVNNALRGLLDKICAAYLDDILIYGRTFEEHVKNFKTVLQRLRVKGIRLRADKCHIFKQEVRYLGRLVSKNGHRPDPEDTEAIEKFREPPKNVGDLRSLMGFLSYYRSYVQDFSKKFKPHYDLLKGIPSKPKNKRQIAEMEIDWTEGHQQTVNEVIDYLRSPEFLAFPDFTSPFIITCDASEKGLGAVLYQKRSGKNRVINFASRTLNTAERNYRLHSGKLEFLGLKWAVCDKFCDYLCTGDRFTVYTDNNPLTYVMSTARLNATGYRWVAELSNFNFDIKYRPGKSNADADALSRKPMVLEELEENCVKMVGMEQLDEMLDVKISSDPPTCAETVDVSVLELVGEGEQSPISREEMGEAQRSDSNWSCVCSGRGEEEAHKGRVEGDGSSVTSDYASIQEAGGL